MEITGKIIQELPLQEGVGRNGNPWQVKGYVLETLEQYPKKVQFEVFGEDRIAQNRCSVDDIATVSFDIESREFNGRWYTSIRAWKVVVGAEPNAAQQQQTAQQAPAPAQPGMQAQPFGQANVSEPMDEGGDDLPF